MSVEELAEVYRQLDKYLAKGWIKLSVSPYRGSNPFCLQKEGTLHMCINFRMLNKQKKIDAYQFPRLMRYWIAYVKLEFSQKLT